MISRLAVVLLLGAIAACDDNGNIRVSRASGPLHYDDFSEPSINASRWTVDTLGNGTAGSSSVTVSNSQARLALMATNGTLQASLLFPTALVGDIGTIEARVTPIINSETAPSIVRFRLFLRPYKDSKYASAGGTDLTSDVFAQVRHRGGFFEAMISRCVDSACASEVIYPVTNLGTAPLLQTYDVKLTWNGGTFFTFSVSGMGSTSFDASLGGPFVKIGPSGQPRAKVEVIADSGAPTTGNATADVDFVDCARWGGGSC